MPSSAPSKIIESLKNDEAAYSAMICMAFERFKVYDDYINIDINPNIVEVAVRSWIDDLDRHSKYHNNIDPNKYKQSAYLMFWIAKSKPIHILRGEFTSPNYLNPLYSTPKYQAVNEIFAIQLGLNRIGINLTQVDEETTKELIYLLYFRPVSPKHLSLTLKQLHAAIQAQQLSQEPL